MGPKRHLSNADTCQKLILRSFQGDRQAVLKALSERGRSLQWAPAVHKADTEIVLTAVQQDGQGMNAFPRRLPRVRCILSQCIVSLSSANFETSRCEVLLQVSPPSEHTAYSRQTPDLRA
eukprot:2027523-Amphidinium_carterae.2